MTRTIWCSAFGIREREFDRKPHAILAKVDPVNQRWQRLILLNLHTRTPCCSRLEKWDDPARVEPGLSYRPSAVERALADDQSGALADARPRRACFQSDQATVGLRQGKVSRLGQEPGARAHYVCAGQPLPGAQTAASSRG